MKHFFKYYYILFHVFFVPCGVALAQQGLEDAPYVNFERFSIVKPAEEIGLIDSLRWGAMAFVNAPAVHRVVPLYAYDVTVNHRGMNCEQPNVYYKNIPSLIVTQGVPWENVINTLGENLIETELVEFKNSGDWLELSEFNDLVVVVKKLEGRKEMGDLSSILSNLNNLSENPELIWDEIRVGDACDLTNIFEHRQTNTIAWKLVDNQRWPQLRKVSRKVSNFAEQMSNPPYTLVTAEPVPKFQSVTQFYAECDSKIGDDQSLCAERLHLN